MAKPPRKTSLGEIAEEVSNDDFPSVDDTSDSREERKNGEVKIRLQLNAPKDHPLSWFSEEVKMRGIKNLDLNTLVLTAISELGDSWWRQILEEHTPLEYKISAALADPAMREKLKLLLASQ